MFLVALLMEDVGFILLSRGMKNAAAPPDGIRKRRILRVISDPLVIIGVILQAAYYFLLLSLIQKVPVSFVVPMTGFGYVLTAFLARIFLKEPVSVRRWTGITLITVGVILVSRGGG